MDLVVIGGGPAGLAAAHAAASHGQQVLMMDQGLAAGGQIWRHRPGDRLPTTARELLNLVKPPHVAVAQRASIIDILSPQELVVSFSGRIARVETDGVILATGAMERLLPFPGWTLPGVTGVGGIQALVKAGLRVTGKRIVLAGSGPLMMPVAATLQHAGGRVVFIGEQATRAELGRFAQAALKDVHRLTQAAIWRAATWRSPYRTSAWVVAAHGHQQLSEVVLSVGGKLRTVACDWLGTAAGLVPRTDVAELIGCEIRSDAIDVDEYQATSVPSVWAAGECCGVKGERFAIAEGTIAGLAAAGIDRFPGEIRRIRDEGLQFAELIRTAFAPRVELNQRVTAETIICRCEDVRREAIMPEWSQRQAKLYTRVGMGACQGAVCGPAGAALFGWQRNAVRPPLEHPEAARWTNALNPDALRDR
jgi:pyruvate/2-oxoglutarate dehydrogenase complex dihydrolipoamide dehydrogenase (E3) component